MGNLLHSSLMCKCFDSNTQLTNASTQEIIVLYTKLSQLSRNVPLKPIHAHRETLVIKYNIVNIICSLVK